MIFHFISYLLVRLVTLPMALLPYRTIHSLGRTLGALLFYLYPKLRKRALSNLALASDLNLTAQEIKTIAKASIQNLAITCLEYSKLSFEKDLTRLVTCENPDLPKAILAEGKGAIFFCGHQANWELLFLDSTSRYPGVAIGRPIENRYLYNWITSIREMMGGSMIPPRQALKESLRAIKQGKFIGIVGDQGMPDSGFSSPFLGRCAWTSPLPAILAFRTGRPIIVCTLQRKRGKYITRYSGPIRPNRDASMEEEIPRLMNLTLNILQESIKENIGQWLWTHNRWKQQLPGRLKKEFRHDTLAIILPEDDKEFARASAFLPSFRKWYPLEFISLYVPAKCRGRSFPITDAAIHTYASADELLIDNYLPKLVFNFTQDARLKKHFLSLSAFGVYSLADLEKGSVLKSEALDAL